MNDYLSEDEILQEQRPLFLTILCILTFVGSGWTILSGIWTYNFAHHASVLIKDSSSRDSISINDTVAASPGATFQKNIRNNIKVILKEDKLKKKALWDIVASLITLAAAILMWRQKRLGYFIYIVGVIISLVVPFILYGNNLIAIGISSFGSFFGLLFIALYSLNLKWLNK